jgi:hypothetical protein
MFCFAYESALFVRLPCLAASTLNCMLVNMLLHCTVLAAQVRHIDKAIQIAQERPEELENVRVLNESIVADLRLSSICDLVSDVCTATVPAVPALHSIAVVCCSVRTHGEGAASAYIAAAARA